VKGSGKPDDRKGQVRFDVAGAGNGFTVRLVRHRRTKETVTDRLHLRNTAPVLDPTDHEKISYITPDRMPRKQNNWPVKVRRGELSVHPASEDPVLRGDSQDRVDRENFLRGGIANSQAVPPGNP